MTTSEGVIPTSTSRSRKTRDGWAVARVDRRTKDLLRRAQPGEIAVIDHEDLDRVSADGLVAARVAGVVNAARSTSGRYPNLGPLVLAQAGVPLIDGIGPLLMDKVKEGAPVQLVGDRLYVDGVLAAVGASQTPDAIAAALDAAGEALADQFDDFARNTISYLQEERDLLFGGVGLPPLTHDVTGRHVLVVVRGPNHRADLAALRPYIQEMRPVLIAVDGGADALLSAGYRPDVIVGDMDSVSERALLLANGSRHWWGAHRPALELIVHAYHGGHAPGAARLDDLGLPYRQVEATGTSEDVAYLLAHEGRAELIVAVGSHANLREFLDKGRKGMASTFLVRLRVGETLMDAKGVSRLYPERVRFRDTAMLVGAAVFAIGSLVLVSEPLRLYVGQLLRGLGRWFGGLW